MSHSDMLTPNLTPKKFFERDALLVSVHSMRIDYATIEQTQTHVWCDRHQMKNENWPKDRKKKWSAKIRILLTNVWMTFEI